MGNALAISVVVNSRIKIGQLCAVMRKVLVIAGAEADLITGQQEDFTVQAVCAGRYRPASPGTFLIRNLDLLDSFLYILIEHVQEIIVQVGMDVGMRVVIVIVVPFAVSVDVLHQYPGSVAARVVEGGVGVPLLHNDKFNGATAFVQLYNTADGLFAECCHQFAPPIVS